MAKKLTKKRLNDLFHYLNKTHVDELAPNLYFDYALENLDHIEKEWDIKLVKQTEDTLVFTHNNDLLEIHFLQTELADVWQFEDVFPLFEGGDTKSGYSLQAQRLFGVVPISVDNLVSRAEFDGLSDDEFVAYANRLGWRFSEKQGKWYRLKGM